MTQTLGSTRAKYVFTCQGTLLAEDAAAVALYLVRAAGMTPARGLHPGWLRAWLIYLLTRALRRLDVYPFQRLGGTGFTLTQFFQPLTESYLVIDVYADLNLTEVLLSTCKPEWLNLKRFLLALDATIGPASLQKEIRHEPAAESL